MRQAVGGLVAARAVFLQALHDDPVQIAPQQVAQFAGGSALPAFGNVGEFGAQRAQAGRGFGRLGFADHAADFVQCGPARVSVSNGVTPVSSS